MSTLSHYQCQLQQADGQIVEKRYSVYWSPDKVPPEEVARACAAEATCGSGRVETAEGVRYAMPHVGLTAVLLKK